MWVRAQCIACRKSCGQSAACRPLTLAEEPASQSPCGFSVWQNSFPGHSQVTPPLRLQLWPQHCHCRSVTASNWWNYDSLGKCLINTQREREREHMNWFRFWRILEKWHDRNKIYSYTHAPVQAYIGTKERYSVCALDKKPVPTQIKVA